MKILIDARMYGLEHAGIGRYLINLTEELAKIDKKNVYFLLLRKRYFEKLELPENWKKVLANFRHYSLLEQIKMPGLISDKNPDLVHFPHFNIPAIFRGRFVVTIHDLTMERQGKDASTLSLPAYLVKRLFYKYIFRKSVANSLKIIVPSRAVKRDLVDYFKVSKDKIRVVHEGISGKFGINSTNTTGILNKYKLKSQSYFIYVGNVYPHKNLGRAIEAVVKLNKDSKIKVILAIASSRNVFTKRLARLIRNYRAEKYIRILGFIKDEELNVLLKNSIAFVYPSLSEGFGLPGLEALSAGTLVLASDIPVFKEVYKDNALFFNPFDFVSIEKAMREVTDLNLIDREKMINKGQKFIKRYSWSKMAKETLSIYNSSKE